jgi:hypothetical protein
MVIDSWLIVGVERAGSAECKVRYWLNRHAAPGSTAVIVERRGRREDDELELEFRRICSGANYDGTTLGRHVLNPAQRNRAFEVIDGKLFRSPQGRVMGWGLKVFP